MSHFSPSFHTNKIFYNSMSKSYLDGSKQLIIATSPVFREPGWELVEQKSSLKLHKKNTGQEMEKICPDIGNRNVEEVAEIVEMSVWDLERMDEKCNRNLLRSMRRARVKVRDYCLSTPMTWFVTMTLDPRKVDRYDVDAMTRRLNTWLGHMVTRRGLAYVMVPELHKDGAIHYHALMTDAIETVDSGTIIPKQGDRPRRPRNQQQREAWLQQGGQVVYNMPEWPYGFTTAIKLYTLDGSYERAVNYVAKYITKGHDPMRASGKVGGRWYYHGGDLGKPAKEYFDADYDAVVQMAGEAAYVVDVSDRLSGVQMAVIWQRPDGTLRAMPRRVREELQGVST